jgi:uncharacterized protein (DUF342 family)
MAVEDGKKENKGNTPVSSDPIAHMKVEIVSGNMEAYFTLNTEGMDFSQIETTVIYNYLTNNTKLYSELIDYNKINEVIATVKKIKSGAIKDTFIKVVIAKGVPLTEGLDGWVKYYHPHNQRVVIGADGKADFRNLEKYITIKQGEKIATVFQGVPGKPGRDVIGTEIFPKAIKKPKIEIGANITSETIISQEEPDKIYNEFSASCDGVLISNDDSIQVSEELRLTTNVGISTGNINYQGSITVEGSIEEGAKVVCTGMLMVNENVESSDLDIGQDMSVKGGIKLKNRGIIKVKGNLRSKFIENAILEVDGDVIVEGSILNSKIYCLGSVLLIGATSGILGSEIIVFGSVSTVNLGSTAGLDVVIDMGYHYKNDKLYNEIGNMIKNSDKELATLVPQVQQMNNIIKQSRGKLDEDRKRKYKELIDTFKQKNELHRRLVNKQEELKTSRFNSEKINLIVKGAGYTGATIKYRRQVEKISVVQSAFMMNFYPGQDHAPMTGLSTVANKKSKA